jgi:hypothetical protein
MKVTAQAGCGLPSTGDARRLSAITRGSGQRPGKAGARVPAASSLSEPNIGAARAGGHETPFG